MVIPALTPDLTMGTTDRMTISSWAEAITADTISMAIHLGITGEVVSMEEAVVSMAAEDSTAAGAVEAADKVP